MKKYIKISLIIQSTFIVILLAFIINLFFFKKNDTPRNVSINNFLKNQEKVTSPIEKEVLNLNVEKNQNLKNIFKKINFKNELQKIDKNLKLISYYDTSTFKKTKVYEKLNQFPQLKIYTILEFSSPIDYQTLYNLERLGFSRIYHLKTKDYLNEKVAIFYVRFNKIKNSFKYSKIINGYILDNYTAQGVYRLKIKSDVPVKDITFNIHTPFSRKGKEIIGIHSRFSEEADTINKKVDKDQGIIKTSLKKNQSITFLSEMSYEVSLNKNLNNNIYILGREKHLKDYQQTMLKKHGNLYNTFTQYSEKIVPSEYISSIVNQIDKTKDLKNIWQQITAILDKDIHYDWQKRDLFFNGNLTYYDIKDMYMTASELGKKKIGACPERTSLEISILRELGIAARSFTRLYHIFTEIYIPDEGWVTTSTTLNEIPISKSEDEKMAYFVNWSPRHPIRLKWEGYLYPTIMFSYFKKYNRTFNHQIGLSYNN